MTLLISVENQNILWEMINKVSLCNTVFPPGSQNEKNNWFKKIIGEYYNKVPANITRNDLYKINRDILSYMVKQLGELDRQNKQINIDRGTFSRTQNPIKPSVDVSEYEKRQSQYNTMFEVQKPQMIDFSEKIDDEVITNMDELIENHKKMREQELQGILPLDTNIQQPIQPIKVNIMDDIPKETIHTVLLEDKEKHVRFDLSENTEYEKLNKKIDDIIVKITKIESKIDSLHAKIDELYNKNDNNKNNKNNDISFAGNNVEIIKQML